MTDAIFRDHLARLKAAAGVEQIVEIRLTPSETDALNRSAAAVKELVDILKL